MVDQALWTVEELVSATNGRMHGVATGMLNGVSIDSRNLSRGDVFVAIKGDKLDGHDFVVAALRAGAGLAIVSRVTEEMRSAGPLLEVLGDPLQALEDMGRAARSRSSAQIIAVTGSVGKTSSKEMLRVALSASGGTHASAASFNNHWGVPLTLSRLSAAAAYGVFEIGMNHPNEITPLVRMVRPHIAIITTVAAVHLSQFTSLDEIAKAKAEIFDGLVPGGSVVINRDSSYFEYLKQEAIIRGAGRIVGFGKHADAEVRLERIVQHPTCCCITAEVMGESIVYKLGMPGEHMAINSLAVLAAVKLAGADLARAALALSTARPAQGRGVQERLANPDGDILLIDESYNANPSSMAAALAILAQTKPARLGRRIAVLGDMLELGSAGPEMHRALAKELDARDVDVLYAAGPLMANLWEVTPASRRGAYASTSAEVERVLLDSLRPGDCVMIKGSNGSKMGLLAQAMRSRWPIRKREE